MGYASRGGPLRQLLAIFFVAILFAPGCLYKMGGNLTAGVLDEASGLGKGDGVNGAARSLLEEQLLRQLGKQLTEGAVSGVTSQDQQARLEATVDAIVAVAVARAGTGLRDDVGPELRAMVRRDLTQALADGLREDIGGSAEEVVDRVVRRALLSVEDSLREPALTVALADMLRETLYLALEEGRPGTPGIGETLHSTLDRDVLDPVESSVGGIAAELAERVDQSAQRTENVLKSVIGGLLVLVAGLGVLYVVSQQTFSRERERQRAAALEALDDEARARVLGAPQPGADPPPTPRSTDYER
ncbi:MAG: hypothetical protein KC912_12740 [Proteobacteria bacterium]|nr:hypothetical protein [Pseudomonadota bacterium]